MNNVQGVLLCLLLCLTFKQRRMLSLSSQGSTSRPRGGGRPAAWYVLHSNHTASWSFSSSHSWGSWCRRLAAAALLLLHVPSSVLGSCTKSLIRILMLLTLVPRPGACVDVAATDAAAKPTANEVAPVAAPVPPGEGAGAGGIAAAAETDACSTRKPPISVARTLHVGSGSDGGRSPGGEGRDSCREGEERAGAAACGSLASL